MEGQFLTSLSTTSRHLLQATQNKNGAQLIVGMVLMCDGPNCGNFWMPAVSSSLWLCHIAVSHIVRTFSRRMECYTISLVVISLVIQLG